MRLLLTLFSVVAIAIYSFEDCIKNLVRRPFATKIEISWRVNRFKKFNVRIYMEVNRLYDINALFKSSEGEDYHIYKYKRKVAIYNKTTQEWMPYTPNLHLRGIKLLNLRQLFLYVLRAVKKHKNFAETAKSTIYFDIYKEDITPIATLIFSKDEIPKDLNGKLTIRGDCPNKLESVMISFNLIDKDTRVHGIIKMNFQELQNRLNIPAGIKKFLGKE
jgi:hypothetical protein